MDNIVVEQKTIDAVLGKLSLSKEEVDLNNFIEFIVFNGLYEDDLCNWDLIPELWQDWLDK